MPRPPLAKQPIKDAALQLFVERGVHATGIRDIAITAGCSEAALYRHWQNKEDLVSALFREHLSEVTQLLASHLGKHQSPQQALLAAIQGLYQLYDDRPYVFRFILLVQHELGPYLPQDTAMPHQIIENFLVSIDADMPQQTRTLYAGALVGIFIECSSRVVYGHLPPPMSQYAIAVCRLCERLLPMLASKHL